ncbi:MAG: hypothetical protein ACM336_12350 [Acidobacteriota bacterium]
MSCPDQSTLRHYALAGIPEAQAAPVEEHLLICEACRRTVSEMDVFGPLLEETGRRVSAAYLHETDDGIITLELKAVPGPGWRARFWGENLEGSAVFDSPAEAYAHLRSAFDEMYPGHICTAACGGDA